MESIFITLCIVVGGVGFALVYMLGGSSVYSDRRTVGVSYVGDKVYECKERK